MRHALVGRIVDAYAKHEAKLEARMEKSATNTESRKNADTHKHAETHKNREQRRR